MSKIGFHAKRFGQGKSPPNGGIAPHQPLRRPVESPFDRGLTELSLKPAHCASWTGSSRPRRPPSGSSAKCTQNTGLMLSKTHHSRLFWTVVEPYSKSKTGRTATAVGEKHQRDRLCQPTCTEFESYLGSQTNPTSSSCGFPVDSQRTGLSGNGQFRWEFGSLEKNPRGR